MFILKVSVCQNFIPVFLYFSNSGYSFFNSDAISKILGIPSKKLPYLVFSIFFVIVFFLFISFLWNQYYNKYLDDLGKKRETHAKESIKEIQNSFGNFRETVIFGLRKLFSKRFDKQFD